MRTVGEVVYLPIPAQRVYRKDISMMDVSDFCDLVIQMRAAQIKYFKERSQSNLIDAKRLEKQVDDALQGKIVLRVDHNQQPVLFNEALRENPDPTPSPFPYDLHEVIERRRAE